MIRITLIVSVTSPQIQSKAITTIMKTYVETLANNQFIIHYDNTETFQSYNSIIAKKENGAIYLDENKWDFSATTGKYRNKFLGEDKKETLKKIKDGTYTLMDLNK